MINCPRHSPVPRPVAPVPSQSLRALLSLWEMWSSTQLVLHVRFVTRTWRASRSRWMTRTRSTAPWTMQGHTERWISLYQVLICCRKFSPKCAGCHKPIVPKKGQTKTRRIRAMGKDFHLSCFKCQVCVICSSSAIWIVMLAVLPPGAG